MVSNKLNGHKMCNLAMRVEFRTMETSHVSSLSGQVVMGNNGICEINLVFEQF